MQYRGQVVGGREESREKKKRGVSSDRVIKASYLKTLVCKLVIDKTRCLVRGAVTVIDRQRQRWLSRADAMTMTMAMTATMQ